jgi:uncharacterized membrane protein
MKKIRQLFIFLFLIISTTIVQAQDKGGFDGLMRSSGRSYVVVAVMLTILVGLVLYLVRLDRKISKLEKEK